MSGAALGRWYNRSIRNKLAIVVFLAAVPALLLASVLGAFRAAESQRASRVNEISGIANALAAAASEPLASGNQRQVANVLKGIGAIPGLTHISVRDAEGQTVFQFGNGILVSATTQINGDGLFNLSTFPVMSDIRHGGKPIGTLLLIADLSAVRDSLKSSLYSALFTGLLSALAGVLASYRMQRSISAPIAELTVAMSEVRSANDFTRAVSRVSHDETGQLVDAFNDMMREINARDTALVKHRDGLEATVRDRTSALADAVDAAQSANRAKSEFLAAMSHEIRTPMNGMLVMAELLAASELTPRAQRHCEVILRSGQTLLSIINDILDLSKIEAGHLTLERVTVDPAAIVDDVMKLFSERAASKGLQFAAYVAPGVARTVLGDPVRLSQILSNLVNNALKFTEAGGVLVRVDACSVSQENTANEAGTGLKFSVIDTGIGIHHDKLASIFDPFTQAEASTTRRFGGTGIGLTICRKLAAAMDGVLSVDSAEGEGSTFAFEVPLEIVTAAMPQDTPHERSGQVVLSMPEGPVRYALTLLAGEFGLKVTEPDSVDLASLRLVFTDRNNLERARALRSKSECRVVLLSRLGDANGEQLLRQGTVQDVLETPFDCAEARDVLQAAFSGRRLQTDRGGHRVAATAAGGPDFKGVRVLAADDSPINREVLVEALSRLNVDVTCVEDGAAAVAAVKSGDFDLVFMDGSMPVLDGFDATRAIRAWEVDTGRAGLPVVGLSAHVVGDRAELWRDCGMSDFITKPFTLAGIRACLERCIGERQLSAPAGDISQSRRSDPPHDTAPLIDVTVLESIREMQAPGDDLVGRVAGLYVKHAPMLRERLLDCAMAPGDLSAIAAAAHALKSLSSNVGAVRIGDICGLIEDAARAGQPMLAEHADSLRSALPDTIKVLEGFITSTNARKADNQFSGRDRIQTTAA